MQGQIEQLYRPLFLYVKNRVNSQEDAEDITQDVFYKLSKSKTDAVHNLKSWVYTIAKNTITDYYRKKQIATNSLETSSFPEEYDHESVAEELSKCVTVFIQKLPEEYRSILTLSELEGMSQKEIAEKLDLNYVTVRSKIQRGRKKLRELFSKCCNVKQGGKGSILGYHPSSTCEGYGCSD